MINGLGYHLANVPTITGLTTVTADAVNSEVTNTSQLFINGVDVSTVLVQVPINTANIAALQQVTTGITYNDMGSIDLTTIDNNVTITSGKKLKCATTATANEDVANKLFVDTAIANLVDSAPATLDTLNELAAALGDDPNFATTVTNLIAGKVSLTTTETISGAKTFTQPLTVSTTNPGGATPSLLVKDPSNNVINFIPYTGAGSYNYIVGGGDSLIFAGSPGLPNTRTLTLSSHSTTFSGVRITPTSVLMGAGSSTTTPTSSVLCSGTDVTVTGYASFKDQTFINSTIANNRQLFNTYYNLMDTTNGTGGNQIGRIYSDPGTCYLEFLSLTHTFTILNALSGTAYIPFSINPTDLIITTTNCPTINGFTLPGTGDSTSKIATTQWVQSVISGGAFTGISYSDVGSIDLTTIDNNLKITKNTCALQFSVGGGIVDPVAGNNSGFISQNTGASATIIQNQATSGLIQLSVRNASNTLTNALQLSTADCTITTTNNPTITGFTLPTTADNTSKIATTQWVQSVISGGIVASQINISATIPPDVYYIPVCSGTGNQTLRSDLILAYDTTLGTPNITSNLNGNASSSTQILTTINNGSGIRYPTFVAGATTENKSLQFDPSTTSLSYKPDTSELGAQIFSVNGVGAASGANASFISQNVAASAFALQNQATSGFINLYTRDSSNLLTTPFSISSADLTIITTNTPTFSTRNIRVNNASGIPITIGNGGSTGSSNIIMTSLSLAATRDFTTGGNVIIGDVAGNGLITSSSNNTIVGDSAGTSATGNGNTLIGYNAGSNITTGATNICIGNNSTVPVATNSSQISIGNGSETMFIRGGFNLRIGTLITASITLSLPLAQHYPVAMSAATQTITLPAPTTASVLGALVTFKRRTNTTAFTIAAGAGTPFINPTSVTQTATFPFGAGLFQATFICDGVNWACFSQG